MTRLVIASCVAAACSVGLGAQGQSGTTPQTPSTSAQQPAQPSAAKDDKSIVLQGCLRAGEQAGTFVLQNASATSGGTLKNATVELSGTPAGANLKDHVGHTVEVTGALAPESSRASGASTTGAGTSASATAGGTEAGTTGSGASAGTAGTAGARGGKAKLTVKTLKHVKESC